MEKLKDLERKSGSKTDWWKNHVKAAKGYFKEEGFDKDRQNIREYPANLHWIVFMAHDGPEQGKRRKKELVDQLNAPNPVRFYGTNLEPRHPGTGQWLLDHGKYERWKEDEASLLWLYGIPGCGKSVLSATIIENLQQTRTNVGDKHVATIYYYFTFRYPAFQTVSNMLRSLLAQLLHVYDLLPSAIETLHASGTHGYTDVSQKALLDALKKVV